MRLQVVGSQASMFGNSSEHFWSDFLSVMEGEHKIRPAFPTQCSMRSGLPHLLSTEAVKRF